MGLFSKKEKAKCPICGAEMGFFSSTSINDGKVCDACLEAYGAAYDKASSQLTIAELQAAKAVKDREAAEAEAKYGKFSGFMKIDAYECLDLKMTEVGIKKAKEFKDKMCLRGLVESGTFTDHSVVDAYHNGEKVEIKLLDIYKGKGPMNDVIASHVGKKVFGKADYVDIIVEGGQILMEGDLVFARD